VLRGLSPDDLEEIAELGVVLMYTDEGLPRGKTYYYSVAALNDVGQGEPFDPYEVKVKKKKSESPGFPATLVLLAIASISLVALRRRR
jgi:hypothetical protein